MLGRVVLISCCIIQGFFGVAHATDLSTERVDADTTQEKGHGWLFYPIFFYSPETKTAFGAGLGYFFYEPGSTTVTRPSTILSNFIYTQNKQTLADLLTDIYWKDEKYHFTGGFGYLKFPDKFYGIGNDTAEDDQEDYTPENSYVSLSLQIQALPGLYLGPIYELYNSELREVEEQGLLATEKVLGSAGGKASCLGMQINWDTRDNIYYPSTGGYHQLSASLFRDDLGGEFNFKRYVLDLRQYKKISSDHILAIQAYGQSTNGDVPFQLLSQLGGDNRMRGYYKGRYRDHDMLVLQTEYRLPLWGRLGLVGFAGVGDVAGKTSKFQLSDFKLSIGIGLRYLFVPKEKLNLRLDFGFGKDSSGFYINFTEAF
jgi:outer membrane protein assembly factor BamA